jgi:hypothetical protein
MSLQLTAIQNRCRSTLIALAQVRLGLKFTLVSGGEGGPCSLQLYRAGVG